MYWESKRRADNPNVFDLELTEEACVGPADYQYLMGGVSLGAGMYAMEQVTGRPMIWASVQFVSNSPVGASCTVTTEVLASGRRAIQARAVIAEGDRPIHYIYGALGTRETENPQSYLKMPVVPGPEQSEPKPLLGDKPRNNLLSRLEMRTARADHAEGKEYIWFRSKDGLTMSPQWLAIVADFMPAGHPASSMSRSLDNTLRLHKLVESEWVLGEVQLFEARNGYFHGDIRMFAEDGTLLATGGQTGITLA